MLPARAVPETVTFRAAAVKFGQTATLRKPALSSSAIRPTEHATAGCARRSNRCARTATRATFAAR
jgi:hypothetical protein